MIARVPPTNLRRPRWPGTLIVLVLTVMVGGCATSFSPAKVRSEIVRQTGSEPIKAFELNVGRITMSLAKKVIGMGGGDRALPLEGLAHFELATYASAEGSTPVDFTRMAFRGWEPTVRTYNEQRSAVVLVREGSGEIGDLVVMASDGPKALYARLSGRLSRELPEALGQALADSGTEGVQRELLSLNAE